MRVVPLLPAQARAAIDGERDTGDEIGFVAPAWVPWAGFVSCVVLLILDVVLMV